MLFRVVQGSFCVLALLKRFLTIRGNSDRDYRAVRFLVVSIRPGAAGPFGSRWGASGWVAQRQAICRAFYLN